MKLSNLSIIFIIIMLPLSVVLSTYMQLQIDVLLAKENYSTKLLDSTYDGILSFEINSLSIDAAEGQSVKSYVSNAINTFFNTMSINMGKSGASNINVQTYVPAILFTTYDGYYIYSPVKTSKVKRSSNDDKGIATEDENGEVFYEGVSGDPVTAIKSESDGVEYDTKSEKKLEYNYMVKPFIYYSANYVKPGDNIGDYNIVVNYSLDNHIALYGRYYDKSGSSRTKRTITKSGYLINLENTKVEIDGNFYVKGSYDTGGSGTPATNRDFPISYDQLDLNEWINLMECSDANFQRENNGACKVVRNQDETYIGESPYNQGYFIDSGARYIIRGHRTSDKSVINNYTLMNKVKNRDNGGESIIDYTLSTHPNDIKVEVNGINITDKDAKEYYLKAYFFSKWVNRELGAGSEINGGKGITLNTINNVYNNNEGNDQEWRKAQILVNNQGINEYTTQDSLFNLESGDIKDDIDEEESIFCQHKKQVIQNSIQYNLNSAISTYSRNYTGSIDFSMPVFSENDWNKILGKVSMAVFMQGLPCGTSTWGDYAIATSTNNKLFVNENNLLFVKNEGAKNDKESSYHKINCNKLKEEISTDPNENIYGAMSYEYAYDAKEETALVYALKEGSDYYKYYKFKNDWYDFRGVKVDKTAEKNNLKNNAEKLSSAYVKYKEEKYTIKSYFFSDGHIIYFFRYSNIGDNGKLKRINKDLADGFDILELVEDTSSGDPVYKYSYVGHASETINLYDHANVDCYWCMMGANYEEFDFEDVRKNSPYFSDDDKKRANKMAKAWYTYIAKYKNNQFKMTDSIQR